MLASVLNDSLGWVAKWKVESVSIDCILVPFLMNQFENMAEHESLRMRLTGRILDVFFINEACQPAEIWENAARMYAHA